MTEPILTDDLRQRLLGPILADTASAFMREASKLGVQCSWSINGDDVVVRAGGDAVVREFGNEPGMADGWIVRSAHGIGGRFI